MSIAQDNDDRIMNYLDGTMTPEERTAFDLERQEDLALDQTVQALEQVDAVLDERRWYLIQNNAEKIKETSTLFKQTGVQEFSHIVRKSQQAYAKKNSIIPIKRLITYISGAAAVGLLALIMQQHLFKPSLSDLFNTYYTTDDLPSFVVKSDQRNRKIEAEKLYKSELYIQALPLFKTVYETSDITDSGVLIYLSLSHLQTGSYEEALYYLDVLEQSNTIDFHKAYWYKALLYLRSGNRLNAIDILQKLSKQKRYFNHKKAIELLAQLD